MQRIINWALAIGALVGLFYGVGVIVPRTTTRKAHVILETPPDKLYAAVSDVANWKTWHPDVDSVRSRSHKDKVVWDITMKDLRSYELEVTSDDRDVTWAAMYVLDGTTCRVNYVFGWSGEGGRIYLTRTADTRDPWRRARLFLWDREESTPVTILDSLAERLGEAVQASE